MMAVSDPAEYGNQVKDVKDLIQEVLKIRLPELVTQSRGEGLPPFFKNGVELVDLVVKVGPVEVGLKLAGPEPRETGAMAPGQSSSQVGVPRVPRTTG